MASGACLSEDEILGFAHGYLTPEEMAALEAHVCGCADCEQLVAYAIGAGASVPSHRPSLPASDRLRLARGTLVGRYTVLSLVGVGGMSEVYAAYDPELDRRVALKLLTSRQESGDSRGEARLLREARAIARLSHPNVIAVYDAGRFGARIFVAMEFVDGETLAAWLRARPRSCDEILHVFLGAARGLAAAHASGLIHRDFKPENVMVASDGTARVTDFGLVQRLYGPEEPETGPVAEAANGLALDLTLTRPGEIVGTPLYMSPEQIARRATDARTDQFSFCVSLYQALYGEHPFMDRGDAGFERLMENVAAGRILAPSSRAAVPQWIRGVLVRGMAAAAEARWSSMIELAAALSRDPARTRRRKALVGAAAVSVVAAAILTGWTAHPNGALCKAGPSHLEEAWTVPSGSSARSERAAALADAFGRTGAAGARETAARVVEALDRYAGRWLAMYRDACEATHVRGEQSPEVLDLRMQCLDDKRAALRALTGALVAADTETVRHAVEAANGLPDPATCGDLVALRAVVRPPVAATRQRAEDLRRRATACKVAHDTGRGRQAIEEGRALVREARELGYDPLLAEMLEMLGSFEINAEFRPESLAILEEATWTALRSKRDDIAVRSATILTAHVGDYANRPADAERWAALARALLDRMGPGHDQGRAWLLIALAEAHQEADPWLAVGYAEEAVTLSKRVLPPDHRDIGLMLTTLAEIRHRLGEDAEAVATVRQAREVLVRAYGPRTAEVALVLSNEGEYLVALGRPADALPLFQESLASWEAALGPDFGFLAYPLTGMGRASIALGRLREARAPLERALRLRQPGEPRPRERAETMFALAQALWADGERRRAHELALSARDQYQRATSARREVIEVDAWLAGHHA